jgi:putative acetyltransferase
MPRHSAATKRADTRAVTVRPIPVVIRAADARDPRVLRLVDALTAELATAGYTPGQTFGYTADRLAAAGVHLVAAEVDGELVGIGGVEVTDPPDGTAELKRFYVAPASRGSGAASAVLAALVSYARSTGVRVLRLETGDKQHAALAFYRRHGFTEIPRFGPYADSETSVCLQRTLVS